MAMRIAVKGATEYLEQHKLKANTAALAECLESWVKAKLPEALHDAKEAMSCGMDGIASMTFGASMIQAGIEAAKEASIPPEIR